MNCFRTLRFKHASKAMLLMTILIVFSMSVREYAHLKDHFDIGTTQSDFDHDLKFHFVTEAVPVFTAQHEYRRVIEVIQPLSNNNIVTQAYLLPDSRAPPISV
jgi:hypothetical protein